jgi:hypothetical protein
VVVTVIVVVVLRHPKEFHSPPISPIGGGHGGCGSNAQASKGIPFTSHIPNIFSQYYPQYLNEHIFKGFNSYGDFVTV